MKGGHPGVEENRNDPCPLCRKPYQAFLPAGSAGRGTDVDPDRICPVARYGNYAKGAYLHVE